ncbi:MAG: NADH-quinone oxidoreductase subunit A [Elusimicrobia bacterium]|nr:NADH-quinone oxidoreductase subunit A [Elusimicrobiota bacterium]
MNILLSPPVAFIITLLFIMFVAELLTPLAPAPKTAPGSGKNKPYGCGEEVSEQRVSPDYQGFFPFAIFFTLLHVAALMIATWSFNPISAGIALVVGYLVAIAVILAILFVG